MRDIILKTLALNEGHEKALDASRDELTDRDRQVLESIRESASFKNLPAEDLDRHTLRHLLTSITVEPVSYCEALSKKAYRLIESGELTAALEEVKTLTEGGMADEDPESIDKVDDKGMYGVGSGGDAPAPSGAADKGTDQGSEHGDSSKTASKGYLDEYDDIADPKHNQPKGDDDKKGVGEGEIPPQFKKNQENPPDSFKKNSGSKDADDDGKYDEGFDEEVQKDAPSADSDEERAANDATYRDGKGQNEAEDGQSGPIQNYKPKAEDPGEPSAGTSGDKGETPDAETPDYSKAKQEDPSNWEGNKGPAQAVNESFGEIEESILRMLESAGFTPGTERWVELYSKGFAHAISERASTVGKYLSEKKKYEDHMPGDDDEYGDDDKMDMEPEEKKKKK